MKKIILVILLLVTACTERSPESSILEKSNCDLPCWNNIIVGQTKESDLLQVLESLPIVDQSSIQNTNQPWSIFDNKIYFAIHQDSTEKQDPKIRGYAYLSENIISQLILCGELHTTIGDIVDAIGEPEHILSGDNIEQSGRLVILVNSKMGISYWYTAYKTHKSQRYEIIPDISVDCVNIFDATLYEKLLDAKLLSGGHYNAEETLKVMYPWSGYGDLGKKYPPRQP